MIGRKIMQRHPISPPSITGALLSIPDRSHCPFPIGGRKGICLRGVRVFLGADVLWGYNVE